MDTAKWRKIKSAMAELLDRDPVEREAYLRDTVEVSIREDLVKLMRAHEAADGFIERSIISERGIDRSLVNDDLVGTELLDYRLVKRIGSGGMGSIYLAERFGTEFDHQTAIKIIKRGMDSESILKRFSRERKILSALKHPNIAQFIDGGVAGNGVPFFVMEFVDGKSLKEFCRSENIGLNERLNIFRQVCGAVEHAHKNLVIHRDLKPSNIIVSESGVPKLLDFGIAKILSDDESEKTATQAKIFTPEYASPEQVAGTNVTTASDVYSLGVMLYELLSGCRPFETKGRSYEEIVHSICVTEPTAPSEASQEAQTRAGSLDRSEEIIADADAPDLAIPAHKLKGDLDNIVLKALRKEPSQRYGSVQQFSDDIDRYMHGMPVSARPQTYRYRIGKYVTRHKAGVSAAALVLISIIGGGSVAAWQSVEAGRERALAERRFNDVRKLANSVIFNYHDAVEKLPGSTEVREAMIRDSAEYLDRLASENLDDRDLRSELASAYERLGDIEGNPLGPSLGDSARAKQWYTKSRDLRTSLLRGNGDDNGHLLKVAEIHSKIAEVEYLTGNQIASVENFRQALAICDELLKTDPLLEAVNLSKARYLRGLAVRGRSPETTSDNIALLDIALGHVDSLIQKDPANPNYIESKADVLEGFGAVLETDHLRRSEAIPFYTSAVEIRKELSDRTPDSIVLMQKYGLTISYIGDTYYEMEDRPNAVRYYREALETLDNAGKKDPRNERLRQHQATVGGSLAFTLAELGDVEESLNLHRSVLATLESRFENDPNDVSTHFKIAMAKEGIAIAYENAAKQSRISAADRLRALRNAQINYEESLQIYSIYQNKGSGLPAINVSSLEAIDAVTAAIARCRKGLESRS